MGASTSRGPLNDRAGLCRPDHHSALGLRGAGVRSGLSRGAAIMRRGGNLAQTTLRGFAWRMGALLAAAVFSAVVAQWAAR